MGWKFTSSYKNCFSQFDNDAPTKKQTWMLRIYHSLYFTGRKRLPFFRYSKKQKCAISNNENGWYFNVSNMSFKVTNKVLDKLGFTEYWANPDESGNRAIAFKNGNLYITDFDEKDDDTDGYASWGTYRPQSFGVCAWFNKSYMGHTSKVYEIVFLEDLHKCIQESFPNLEEEFVTKCKELKMQWGLIDAKPRYEKF